MFTEVHRNVEAKMTKTVGVFQDNLNSVRAGRANPSLLDRITVDYYGTATPLKQVANVSTPEPRMLVIAPWDATLIQAIEKAITTSDLGINPSNDGKIIRLVIPMLTEERRRDLTKLVKKMAEEAKVAIRNERRHANDKLKKQEKNGELTKDDLKDGEEAVQKLTDTYIKKIDAMEKEKESELLEV
jgi:ribosome recycling factor